MTPYSKVSFPAASDGDSSDIESIFEHSDDDTQGRERMEVRRNSPKIKRRKKRSKVPMDAILQTEEIDDDGFYQSSKSAEEVYYLLQESTSRLQRATDGFLQAAETLLTSSQPSHASLKELFADQGHPVSNEIKDAIDDGFYTLTACYSDHYLRPATTKSSEEFDPKPLGEQTKALLMAFLPLPLLPFKFAEVASFCGYIAAQRGSSSISTEEHAVAMFYNVVRYLGEQHHHEEHHGETLDSLAEPMEMVFANKRALLRELLRGVGREQIESCRGTCMYKVLTMYQRGKKIGLR
eukprot:CAMPEP_0119015164 /NCGR_PEP_ID=MMETSP1176-20130426/10592_1 /TAXON_ID=265551 /ORGANISM="Synedropsis recta cf, Strain CCMP1620" /LENGTH=293 /DNA_ID=CAMNT_0006968433 /DNA_START=73 /DNA_END=951 /DNA_ORIENTATION=-